MNTRKINLLNKQGSKQFNILNMKPFVKLTKKQYRSSSRLNYIYGLEYKKRLHRQNLINNLTYNNFGANISYFQNWKQKSMNNKYHLNSYNSIVPFSSTTKYSAFMNNSNLWAIQKQTTALRVFPQSSSFWLHSSDKLESIFTKMLSKNSMTIMNRKNKLWTAGFVKVRKLRLYYTKQLQNTNKLLYWLGRPSSKNLRKILNNICMNNNSNILTWSVIKFIDSLWSNILVKTNFVYNSSASCSLVKQRKARFNGFTINRMYSFSKPGDIIYKS